MNNFKLFLDEKINPYLNSHGGGVEVISYCENNGLLILRIFGQCCTCPHSIETNEFFIKKELFKNFPDLKIIEIESGLPEELWEFAKNILKGGKNKHEKLER